jgi:hypothetical protein
MATAVVAQASALARSVPKTVAERGSSAGLPLAVLHAAVVAPPPSLRGGARSSWYRRRGLSAADPGWRLDIVLCADQELSTGNGTEQHCGGSTHHTPPHDVEKAGLRGVRLPRVVVTRRPFAVLGERLAWLHGLLVSVD